MLVFGLGAAALAAGLARPFCVHAKNPLGAAAAAGAAREPAATLSLLRVEPLAGSPQSASEPGSVADSGADTPAAPTIASTEAAAPAAPPLAANSERSTLTPEDLKAAPVTAPPAAASQPDSPAPVDSIAQADSAAKTDNASPELATRSMPRRPSRPRLRISQQQPPDRGRDHAGCRRAVGRNRLL
ncbi:MAG: hypothetical protein MZV49_10165 [Rhodopseudomonas palustris]|nr:hypothetical protein [Rhodopseudomonas palustris]